MHSARNSHSPPKALLDVARFRQGHPARERSQQARPTRRAPAQAVQNALLRHRSFIVSRYCVAWSAHSVLLSHPRKQVARSTRCRLRSNGGLEDERCRARPFAVARAAVLRVPAPPHAHMLFPRRVWRRQRLAFARRAAEQAYTASPLAGAKIARPATTRRSAGPAHAAARATPPVTVLLVACSHDPGARWMTAMARQMTLTATWCPTKATERQRTRHVGVSASQQRMRPLCAAPRHK